MTIRAVLSTALLLAGCQSTPLPPLAQASAVDLRALHGGLVRHRVTSRPGSRRDAYNAVESYRIASDGSIETTFTFLEGGFDGKPRRYTPRGFVLDRESNAVWGMQFVWPIKADYRIAYVSDDYGQTVIARTSRDYVWIMARTPEIPDADYQRLVQFVADQGYDVSLLRKVPQRWNTAAAVAGGQAP